MGKRRFDDHNELDFERNDKRNKPARGQRINTGADMGFTPPSGTWRQNVQGNLYRSTDEVNRGNR